MYPLLQHSYSCARGSFLSGPAQQVRFMKDMNSDVARLKSWFGQVVGCDWATATVANSNSKLGITRGQLPWVEVETVMTQTGPETATPGFVAKHARNLTSSFYAWVP